MECIDSAAAGGKLNPPKSKGVWWKSKTPLPLPDLKLINCQHINDERAVVVKWKLTQINQDLDLELENYFL